MSVIEASRHSLSDVIDARDYRRIVEIERQNYSDAFKFWENGIEKKWTMRPECSPSKILS